MSKQKDVIFTNKESLKSVENILDEIDYALEDRSRNTKKFATASKIVAGGLYLGLGALSAPALIGIGIINKMKKDKLNDEKQILYRKALEKQTALLEALIKESSADKKRIDYLHGLNTLLQQAITNLKHDLNIN